MSRTPNLGIMAKMHAQQNPNRRIMNTSKQQTLARPSRVGVLEHKRPHRTRERKSDIPHSLGYRGPE